MRRSKRVQSRGLIESESLDTVKDAHVSPTWGELARADTESLRVCSSDICKQMLLAFLVADVVDIVVASIEIVSLCPRTICWNCGRELSTIFAHCQAHILLGAHISQGTSTSSLTAECPPSSSSLPHASPIIALYKIDGRVHFQSYNTPSLLFFFVSLALSLSIIHLRHSRRHHYWEFESLEILLHLARPRPRSRLSPPLPISKRHPWLVSLSVDTLGGRNPSFLFSRYPLPLPLPNHCGPRPNIQQDAIFLSRGR